MRRVPCFRLAQGGKECLGSSGEAGCVCVRRGGDRGWSPRRAREVGRLSVLSSQPNQVSGGDALVRVDAPPRLLDSSRATQRQDVTAAFTLLRTGARRAGGRPGLGKNELEVPKRPRRPPAAASSSSTTPPRARSSPAPIVPFVCKTTSPSRRRSASRSWTTRTASASGC